MKQKEWISYGVAAALLASLAGSAWAAGEDLQNCRWQNGKPIEQRICDKLRELDARERIKQERIQAQLDDIKKREEERKAAAKVAEEERARQREADRAREQAEQEARKKEWDAEQARYEREERALQKKAAAALKEKKDACGDDYGKPKIGMTVARAQECVGKFKLVSEVNRADGVLSTYSNGGTYLHVMGGRVVGWGRY